jgi:hypothetical protein
LVLAPHCFPSIHVVISTTYISCTLLTQRTRARQRNGKRHWELISSAVGDFSAIKSPVTMLENDFQLLGAISSVVDVFLGM